MPGPLLEVADIFRAHGAAWRAVNAPSHRLQANDCRAMGHISLTQLKVMSAIERCRRQRLADKPVLAYLSRYTHHCPAVVCMQTMREGGNIQQPLDPL